MGVRFKMFLLELQSQKEMTPLSQLVPRKEGYSDEDGHDSRCKDDLP